MGNYENQTASMPKIQSANALQVVIESSESNLKFLCEIKTKVAFLKELLVGSSPTPPTAEGVDKSPAPNGMVEKAKILNRCVDMTQHEIMDDLTAIEKSLIG